MGLAFTPTRLNDLVVDVSLTSVARGDILYRGASKWNNLAAGGTAGGLLTTGGAGADPAWATTLTAQLTFANATTYYGAAAQAATLRQVAPAAGAGNGLTIRGDDAASGNTAGGSIVLLPGAKSGSGTDGRVCIRQPGGVAGTDDLLLDHDGTDANIYSQSGKIRLNPNDVVVLRTASNNRWGWGAWIQGYSGGRVSWGPNGEYGSDDTSISRAAAGVVAILNGSSAGKTLSSPPLTPAQITSNQDNYAPGVARYYRLSSDASRDITGLSASQVDGQECFFFNIGAQNIVLKHDVTSTAANRFYCVGSADITMAANDIAKLTYDGTSSRWRVGKL